MKRRDLLKTMGAVAGAAGLSKFLPGCGDGGGGAGGPDAGDEGPPGIKNVVLLMFENRSYDHWLGARSMLEGKGGDGLVATMSNRDSQGNEVKIWEASGSLCVPDPPHSWGRSHEQWGSGANAGFLTTHQLGAPGDLAPMQYMTRQQLPVTWALADDDSLLTAVLEHRPQLVTLSFGDPAPYVERVHEAGAIVLSQINTIDDLRVVEAAGVDAVIAQGHEAGGHTGRIGTLPLLQEVLESTSLPVLAAGGIATPNDVIFA